MISMTEPESLDEQALQETANEPPEYQHPEDVPPVMEALMWIFQQYEDDIPDE